MTQPSYQRVAADPGDRLSQYLPLKNPIRGHLGLPGRHISLGHSAWSLLYTGRHCRSLLRTQPGVEALQVCVVAGSLAECFWQTTLPSTASSTSGPQPSVDPFRPGTVCENEPSTVMDTHEALSNELSAVEEWDPHVAVLLLRHCVGQLLNYWLQALPLHGAAHLAARNKHLTLTVERLLHGFGLLPLSTRRTRVNK